MIRRFLRWLFGVKQEVIYTYKTITNITEHHGYRQDKAYLVYLVYFWRVNSTDEWKIGYYIHKCFSTLKQANMSSHDLKDARHQSFVVPNPFFNHQDFFTQEEKNTINKFFSYDDVHKMWYRKEEVFKEHVKKLLDETINKC